MDNTKFKVSPLNKAIKNAFFVSSILAFNSATTFAANEDASGNNEENTVIVTGSRIVGLAEAASTTPVVVFDSEQLEKTGAVRLADALFELPQIGLTSFKSTESGSGGATNPDLRDLGADRTLVLVNGRRHVGSFEGSSLVDMDTIATDMVDRVEILTGGASSIYGSDAVAGVINIILKNNYEGAKLRINSGIFTDNDESDNALSLTYGTNFDKSKGNILLNISWNEFDSVKSTDRPFPNTSYGRNPDSLGPDDGIPDFIPYFDRGWAFSSTNGVVYGVDGQLFGSTPSNNPFDIGWNVNTDGTISMFDAGSPIPGSFNWAGGDGTRLGNFNFLRNQGERFIISTSTNYDLSDTTNIFFEAKLVDSETIDPFSPHFIDFRDFAVFGGNTQILRDNPFIPDALGALMDANGVTSLYMERDNSDIGNRATISDRKTTRFVAGVQGSFWDDKMDFEASVNFGKTTAKQQNRGDVLVFNLAAALDATTDANGNPICRNPGPNASPGCVPINLFGQNVSPEALNYVSTTTQNKHELKQTVINFNATTNTDEFGFELPAGGIGLAYGLEYREEETSADVDQVINDGLTFSNTILDQKGSYDVTEAYIETRVPLLEDVAGAKSLQLDAAYRYADYSTIGGDSSWKYGLNYQPVDGLTFRATKSKALRAPNIGELFAAPSQTFRFFNDPCSTDTQGDITDPTVLAQVQANCTAEGIPSDYLYVASSNTPGLQGGNPNLDAEETDSFVYGMAWQPNDDLLITADYVKIDIENAIRSTSLQFILDSCYQASSLDNQFCELFSRDTSDPSNPDINSFLLTQVNVSEFQYEAIDFNVKYHLEIGEMGSLDFGLVSTNVLRNATQPDEGSIEFDDAVGEANVPKWRHNFSVNWAYNDFNIFWNAHYTGEQKTYNSFRGHTAERFSLPVTGGHTIHDLNISYDFNSDLKASIGINDVFDKEIPLSAVVGANGGYDFLGQYAYLDIVYNF